VAAAAEAAAVAGDEQPGPRLLTESLRVGPGECPMVNDWPRNDAG
jgi:hypothetical protein